MRVAKRIMVRHIKRARVCPDANWLGVTGVQSQVFGGYSRARIWVVSPDFTGGVGTIPDRNVQRLIARVDI